MELLQFSAKNLNHISKIKVDFRSSINFITGVNGSGKTSLLSAVVSLLHPNLEGLSGLSYDEMAITFRYKNVIHEVKSTRKNDIVTIGVKGLKGTFKFRPFEEDYYSIPEEGRSNYYSQLMSENSSNDTLEFLDGIPTPMYLGLDRRYRGASELEQRRLLYRPSRRKKRNVFGSMHGDSLLQAIGLAEEKFRVIQSRTSQLNKEFVRDLLLALLSMPVAEPFGVLDSPTKKDRDLVDQARKAILKFPRVEGISAEDVRKRIEPRLTEISKTLKDIPEGFNFRESGLESKADRDAFNAIMQWGAFKPTLEQINSIAGLITNYNQRDSSAKKEINQYVSLIESFLDDTSKTIGFNERGRLEVQFGKSRFGIEELSSGEAQIFVLLTHLAFNQSVKEAGVFIIDEPELSLHILWQEILVDNLIKANPKLQYILATHSPSIILDRTELATDISEFSLSNG